MNKWCWKCSWTFRATTPMCHEIPRLANQSDCGSLYFCGRNFIAQSWVIWTEFSWRLSRTDVLASSCLQLRSWCAFHTLIQSTARRQEYVKSSSSSPFIPQSTKQVSRFSRTSFNISHCMQYWSCEWLQVPLNGPSLLSLRAYVLRWSATFDDSTTWTWRKGWTYRINSETSLKWTYFTSPLVLCYIDFPHYLSKMLS